MLATIPLDFEALIVRLRAMNDPQLLQSSRSGLRWTERRAMTQGPTLIFDKSTLESLNLDEAVLLDNFYQSTITPLFFVECLADLEKRISSKSSPEQLVGSLADRTPDSQSSPNVHHMNLLAAELSRQFDLRSVWHRPALAGGRRVQLGDQKGVVFQRSPEAEALARWTERQFLEVERNAAKQWRRSLTRINLKEMADYAMAHLGPWRKPRTLEDGRQLAQTMIDSLDPEYLFRFGIELFGLAAATDWVMNDWTNKRRPPLTEYAPYFVFMLTINLFFYLVLQTQLLSKVKESHAIDLAYLYYLPFCSVFTSKDNFHVQVAPLFLAPDQTFVNGIDLKDDLKRLNNHYTALPPEILKTGLSSFAHVPPGDVTYLTTRLWDKYMPGWQVMLNRPAKEPMSRDEEKKLVEKINRLSQSPDLQTHDERDIDKLQYAVVERRIFPKKGKYWRYPENQMARAVAHEEEQARRSSDQPPERDTGNRETESRDPTLER
jgi:hypothetical protein